MSIGAVEGRSVGGGEVGARAGRIGVGGGECDGAGDVAVRVPRRVDPPGLRGSSCAARGRGARSAGRPAARDAVHGGMLAERGEPDGAVRGEELRKRGGGGAADDHGRGAVRDVRADPREERHAGRRAVSAAANAVWTAVAGGVRAAGEAVSGAGKKGGSVMGR